MQLTDDYFAGATSILDVGGWFLPEQRATHVIDLMPWETRGVKLTLGRLPGERFSRDTWYQADFLAPDFVLPFADKSFDLVVCGETIEDLSDPRKLLLEMSRVGKRGVIECPSRLAEQTLGKRDRESKKPGYLHHHWIVDSVGGDLLLYSKSDSKLDAAKRLLPLTRTEALLKQRPLDGNVFHHWQDHISFRLVEGLECLQEAERFVSSMQITAMERIKDKLLRFARRARSRIRGNPKEDFSWWVRIVEVSKPYTRIELK